MGYQIIPAGGGRGRPGVTIAGPTVAPTDEVVAALAADTASDTYAAWQTATDLQVEAAFEDYAPGVELGYASRTSNFTTTNTLSNNAAGNITGLTVTFTGQGRPVDLRFFAPTVYHSVANTFISVVIVGTSITDANNQIGSCVSASTTTGPSLSITRRTGVLTDGVSYTFAARAWAAAGTSTFVGATYCPIELSVTSR